VGKAQEEELVERILLKRKRGEMQLKKQKGESDNRLQKL